MEQTPPFPSPEELKSKLADFMKSNFGDRVAFTTLTQPDTVETGTDEKSPPEEAKEFEFHFLPRDIKAHLDRFVIKQDEAKKVLSIAVCDHYNHVNHVRQLERENANGAVETEYAKQNVILVGPTGVGKTYLIKHIADLIKVPFVRGAFERLKEQVSRRVKGQIGFSAEPIRVMDNELFQFVTTQDFIEFGFEPEFIGRLPVRVVCEELSADDLFSIMKYSEGSLLRQYERAFRAYGIAISFEDEALRLMAQAGAMEKTGARGLLTVWEKLFRDFKFYLAGSGISQLRVTVELVRAPKRVLDRLLAEGHKHEVVALDQQIDVFSESFRRQHDLEIAFEDAARRRLVERAQTEKMSMADLTAHLFRDFHFGLTLVRKNSGQNKFTLPLSAVNAPDKFLSDLVVQSYYPTNRTNEAG